MTLSVHAAFLMIASGRLPFSGSANRNIPTVAGTYPGFFATSWFGIYPPAGTPADVIQRLNAALNTTLAAEDVRSKLTAASLQPAQGTPEALAKLTRDDYTRWVKLIKEGNNSAD